MLAKVSRFLSGDGRSGAETRKPNSSRRRMLGSAVGGAAVAAFALGGGGRRAAAQANEVDGIVGAWVVDITSTSSPYKGVQAVHADGTLALTFPPAGPSASGQPPRLYATGYGVWTKVGAGEYAFSLTALSVTEAGIYQGQVSVDGHAMLSDDLQTLQSTYSSRSTDASGGLVGTNGGTITGARIAVTYV